MKLPTATLDSGDFDQGAYFDLTSTAMAWKEGRKDDGKMIKVRSRASERGNFSNLLLSFSLEHYKVPICIRLLPFYVSPPPSPHLIASAFTATSHPPANTANFCSQTKKILSPVN